MLPLKCDCSVSAVQPVVVTLMQLMRLKPCTAPSLFTRPLTRQPLTFAWIDWSSMMPALESVVTADCVTLQLAISTFIPALTWIPAGVKKRVLRFCRDSPDTLTFAIFNPQTPTVRTPYSEAFATVPLLILTLESAGPET